MRNNRKDNELREIKIDLNIMENAFSSLQIQTGNTKVLCTASINNALPQFIDENESGWLTAEYNMLPGSTLVRKSRTSYKPDSRNLEIQRLIGRSLRSCIDLKKIKGYCIIIDCDVIQADGGTRTASINGGYIVLALAVKRMLKEKIIELNPLLYKIGAVSAGIVEGKLLLDLDYTEDCNADVDFNLVMNDSLNFIELQGTAEKKELKKKDLMKILNLCQTAIEKIFVIQNEILKRAK